jgi:hypothetical protein
MREAASHIRRVPDWECKGEHEKKFDNDCDNDNEVEKEKECLIFVVRCFVEDGLGQ